MFLALAAVGLVYRVGELLYVLVLGLLRQLLRPVVAFAEAGFAGLGAPALVALAEGGGEVGGDGRDLEARTRLPEGVAQGAGLQFTGLLVRVAGVGVEPADGRRCEVAVGPWPGADGIEGGDGVAGADLAAVDAVV